MRCVNHLDRCVWKWPPYLPYDDFFIQSTYELHQNWSKIITAQGDAPGRPRCCYGRGVLSSTVRNSPIFANAILIHTIFLEGIRITNRYIYIYYIYILYIYIIYILYICVCVQFFYCFNGSKKNISAGELLKKIPANRKWCS